MSSYIPTDPNQTADTAIHRFHTAQDREWQLQIDVLRISNDISSLDRVVRQRTEDLARLVREETEMIEALKKKGHNLVKQLGGKIVEGAECANIVRTLGRVGPSTWAETIYHDSLNKANEGAASQFTGDLRYISHDLSTKIKEYAQSFDFARSVNARHDCWSEDDALSYEKDVVPFKYQEEDRYQCSNFGHGSAGCKIYRKEIFEHDQEVEGCSQCSISGHGSEGCRIFRMGVPEYDSDAEIICSDIGTLSGHMYTGR